MRSREEILSDALARSIKFQRENPEIYRERQRKTYLAHREERLEKAKAYVASEKGKAVIAARNKAKSEEIKAKKRAQNKTPPQAERNREFSRIWRQTERGKVMTAEYFRRRRKNDLQYNLKVLLRTRLNHAVKGRSSESSAVRMLGCTMAELIVHLESKFRPGMTWENRGKKGWHIDHIKPLSAFDLTDPGQVSDACHYTNLQPLWWKENLDKRVIEGCFANAKRGRSENKPAVSLPATEK